MTGGVWAWVDRWGEARGGTRRWRRACLKAFSAGRVIGEVPWMLLRAGVELGAVPGLGAGHPLPSEPTLRMEGPASNTQQAGDVAEK